MSQHYTRNTVSAAAWCTKCGKETQHRIDDRRVGPCLVCLEKPYSSRDPIAARPRTAAPERGLFDEPKEAV